MLDQTLCHLSSSAEESIQSSANREKRLRKLDQRFTRRRRPDVANEVKASLSAVDHGTNSRMRTKPTSVHGRCTSLCSCFPKCTVSKQSGKRPDLHSSRNGEELLWVTRQCCTNGETKAPAAGQEPGTREAYTRGDRRRGHERRNSNVDRLVVVRGESSSSALYRKSEGTTWLSYVTSMNRR